MPKPPISPWSSFFNNTEGDFPKAHAQHEKAPMTETMPQNVQQLVVEELAILSPALGLMGQFVSRHDGLGLGLLALDASLRSLPQKVTEEAILQIRLAWWREKLSLLPEYPKGHPLLSLLSIHKACWLEIAEPILQQENNYLFDPQNHWKASKLLTLYDARALLQGKPAPLAANGLSAKIFQMRQQAKLDYSAEIEAQIKTLSRMKPANEADQLLCACLAGQSDGMLGKMRVALLGARRGAQAAASLRNCSISLRARSQ